MTAITRVSTDLLCGVLSRRDVTLQLHFQRLAKPSVSQPQLETDKPQGAATIPSSHQSAKHKHY